MKKIYFLKNIILLIFVITCFISEEIKPQNNMRTNWVDMGLGIGSAQDRQLHFNFGFNVNWQEQTYFHSAGFNMIQGSNNNSDYTLTIDYGLGYSWLIKKILISSINIGPSLSIGNAGDENNNLFFWGVGVSIGGQLFVSPLFFLFPEFAVGVEPFMNYNFFESKQTNMPYVFGIRFSYNLNDNK